MKQNELFLYSLLKHSWFESSEKLQVEDKNNWGKLLDLATKYTLWNDSNKDSTLKKDNVLSIFSAIQMNGKKGEAYYHPVQRMSINKTSVFPDDYKNLDKEIYKEYLIKRLENLEHINAQQVFFLLQQEAWSVTNDKGGATLSLFEFLKIRAAFVQCLAQQEDDKQPFLMLSGGVSGIQSFIYNIHSNKAAKSIKGRSFYLQLLLDSIVHQLIVACKVTVANVIYASGGKFCILLPNTEEIKTQISSLEAKITQYIFDKHQERLFVCLDYVSFGLEINGNKKTVLCSEIIKENQKVTNFSDLWKAAFNKSDLKKARKNKLLLVDQTKFNLFFRGDLAEIYNGNNVQICAVTGQPTTKNKTSVLNKKDKPQEEDKIYVTKSVEEQVELGEKLVKAKYYTVKSDYNLSFDPFKICDLSETKNANTFCYQLNPIGLGDNNEKVVNGMLFYGGNEQALIFRNNRPDKLQLKTYEELAEPPKGKNLNKLAILRMDVDDLSLLFTRSIQDLESSLTAYSFMSSMIHWFFAGHLNEVRTPYKDHLNIQYAGGDDLFVVGRWKEVLEFAKDIRIHFSDFIRSNTMLTLSAGLVMVNPKFPISKAADLADEALDKAKAYKNKNAFCIGSQVVEWGKDFDFVWKLKDLMIGSLEELEISKGLLYKLQIYKEQQKRGSIDWRWQSAYMFQKYQNYAQSKQKTEAGKLLKVLKEGLFTGCFHYESTNKAKQELITYKIKDLREDTIPHKMLDLYCLAAKLADYYLR